MAQTFSQMVKLIADPNGYSFLPKFPNPPTAVIISQALGRLTSRELGRLAKCNIKREGSMSI